jgi:hypothetical protein
MYRCGRRCVSRSRSSGRSRVIVATRYFFINHGEISAPLTNSRLTRHVSPSFASPRRPHLTNLTTTAGRAHAAALSRPSPPHARRSHAPARSQVYDSADGGMAKLERERTERAGWDDAKTKREDEKYAHQHHGSVWGREPLIPFHYVQWDPMHGLHNEFNVLLDEVRAPRAHGTQWHAARTARRRLSLACARASRARRGCHARCRIGGSSAPHRGVARQRGHENPGADAGSRQQALAGR